MTEHQQDDTTRPVEGTTAPAPEHHPLTLETGPVDCIDRECDEYFNEDGVEELHVASCSHLTDVIVCGKCSKLERHDGFYEATVPWPCPAVAVAGSAV